LSRTGGVGWRPTPSGCERLVDIDTACGAGEEIGDDRLDLPHATQFVAVQQTSPGSHDGVSPPPSGPMEGGRAEQASMTVDNQLLVPHLSLQAWGRKREPSNGGR
jgi:hypothetical protein